MRYTCEICKSDMNYIGKTVDKYTTEFYSCPKHCMSLEVVDRERAYARYENGDSNVQ